MIIYVKKHVVSCFYNKRSQISTYSNQRMKLGFCHTSLLKGEGSFGFFSSLDSLGRVNSQLTDMLPYRLKQEHSWLQGNQFNSILRPSIGRASLRELRHRGIAPCPALINEPIVGVKKPSLRAGFYSVKSRTPRVNLLVAFSNLGGFPLSFGLSLSEQSTTGKSFARKKGSTKEVKKEINKYYTSYSKLSEVKLLTIGIASPLRILQWAEKTLPNGKIYGEVLNANTLHHKTFKPQKGGLFCERIFGPLKDFECACGKIDKSNKQSQTFFMQESSKNKTNVEVNSSFKNPPSRTEPLSHPCYNEKEKKLLSTNPSFYTEEKNTLPNQEKQIHLDYLEEGAKHPLLQVSERGEDTLLLCNNEGEDGAKVLRSEALPFLAALCPKPKGDQELRPSTPHQKNINRKFCPDCDVEYTWSVIRRYQLGYIKLCSPVTHIWFLKGTPSYLSLLLDMKKRYLQFITYCSEILTIEKSSLPIYSVGNMLKSNSLPLLALSEKQEQGQKQENEKEVGGYPKLFLKTQEPRSSTSPECSNLKGNVAIPARREGVALLPQRGEKQLKKLKKKPIPKKEWYSNRFQNHVFSVQSEGSEKFLSSLWKNKAGNSIQLSKAIETLPSILFLPKCSKKFLKEGISIISILSLSVYCKNFSQAPSLLEERVAMLSGGSERNVFFESSSMRNWIFQTHSFKKGELRSPLQMEKNFTKEDPNINNVLLKELLSGGASKSFAPNFKNISKKISMDLYILCLLERTLHKSSLTLSIQNTWEYLYKQAFIKAINKAKIICAPALLCSETNEIPDGEKLLRSEALPFLAALCPKPKGDQRLRSSTVLNKWFFSSFVSDFPSKVADQSMAISARENPFGLLQPLQVRGISKEEKQKVLATLSKRRERSSWEKVSIQDKKQYGKETKIKNLVLKNLKIKYINHVFKLLENIRYPLVSLNYTTKFFPFGVLRIYSQKKSLYSVSKGEREEVGSYLVKNTTYIHRFLTKMFLNSFLLDFYLNIYSNKNLLFLPLFEKSCEVIPCYNRKINEKSWITTTQSVLSVYKNFLKMKLAVVFFPFSGCYAPPQLFSRSNLEGLLCTSNKVSPPGWRISEGAKLLKSEAPRPFLKKGELRSSTLDFPSVWDKAQQEREERSSPFFKKGRASLFNSVSFGSKEGEGQREDEKVLSKSLYIKERARVGKGTTSITKNLYNNVYTLSHRERWDIEKDWQIFTLFTFGTTEFLDFPIYTYKNRLFSYINSEDYTGAFVPQSFQQNEGLLKRGVSFSLSSSFYSGAGIVQQLLNEFNFYEIKKLDTQNRLILYQLNKYILKLKKQVQIFVYDKTAQIELKELCKKRDLLIRRTKLVRKLFRKNSNPASMILTLIPVLPPDLRPIVKMGSQIAASDLNRLYQRVIYRNDRLKKFLKDPATSQSYEMKYAQRLLQECLTSDHEVLTTTGWVSINNVTLDHKVATLDRFTGELKYQQPTKVHHYDFEGELYHVKNQQVDLLTTLDHRMLVKRRERRGAPDNCLTNYQLIPAKDIQGKLYKYLKTAQWNKIDYQFYLPTIKFKNSFLNSSLDMDAWLYFFGMWMADGFAYECKERMQYTVCVTQFKTIKNKKPHKIQQKDNIITKIEESIKKLGYNYTYKDSTKTFIIQNKQLCTYLAPLSTGAGSKVLPDWVWELSQRQARILLEGMHDGDGAADQNNYYTASTILADQIQRLTLHAGWSANKYLHAVKGTPYKINEIEGLRIFDFWRLGIIKKSNNPAVNSRKEQKQDKLIFFKGSVYCISVPNEIFYVRRNGLSVWTGNSVDNLLQNGKSGPNSEKDARGRALKSLSDVLKGKQGRFRQFLLGKRVDYSGRSVIVVGPKLKLHECGLPLEMAKELYLPFLLKSILNKNYAKTVVGAKTLIKNNSSLAHELLREIMQVSPVLLNRAPTLHRLGIQAFVPKLIEGRAILLHPLVCSAFNADFDGDQMAVHIPITVEARAEAWKMMLSRNNILSTATGDPLAIPSQDMVLGCYYLTTFSNHGKNLRGSGMYFNSLYDVMQIYEQRLIDVHSLVWVKWTNFIENGTDQEEPLEIRVSLFGQWQEITSNYHRIYDSHNNLISQYICTTPGRILFNLIIQNTTLN
uniref:RNA polymerase beta' subunit n=1 Tax=Chlorococcum tatrense TaxID=915274 RepID=UPI0010C29EEC|nr:RNA polymerase beta' subunit [Chlorococcum tatrense]AYQ94367.1 RNA polymerase beta' subunit [Chlorococcum tatrense]